jgi:hypothetical protein
MSGIETNIFPLENPEDLASECRRYRIRGLRSDQAEYYQNVAAIQRKLGYTLQAPVVIVDLNDEPQVVVPADCKPLPQKMPLVRTVAYLDALPGRQRIDFAMRSPENDAICLRFLQFMLQAPLYSSPGLWQPASGQPFFEKRPADSSQGVDRFSGFAVRSVVGPDGRLGICVDIRTTFLSSRSLPVHIDRERFRSLKGKHCIYRYGHSWYDIQLQSLHDLNVVETEVREGDGWMRLLDFIVNRSAKPLPRELAELPHDAAVVCYQNNRGENRYAPAGLCYRIFDTQSREVQMRHGETIRPPGKRREEIQSFVKQHLARLRFGDREIRVRCAPSGVPRRMFLVPDLEFGQQRVLSVRGTPTSEHVSLDNLGRHRLSLLRDKSAGFFVTDPLARQYLLLPQSVVDSWGSQFTRDLVRAVDELYPQEHGYSPQIVGYDDRRSRTFLEQGKAILEAARTTCTKDGYAVVMIHETRDGHNRAPDQLAAMVVHKFRELDIVAAVIHSTTATQSYEMVQRGSDAPFYQIRDARRSKMAGYLRNVALNKVLLTNERWPFVLATSLHADLTVGIDVKQNTAGFTVVSANGRLVRTRCFASRQKEQLSADLVRTALVELVTAEARDAASPPRTIVLHRDGRTWPSELRGAKDALTALKHDGIVTDDATLTVLEIAKSSMVPLRLFDLSKDPNEKVRVLNPQVGTYCVLGSHAYLCSTGRAFQRPGTVQPLHIRYVDGGMPFEECLEDAYALTCLAWTRPEDCTRYPITLKLTDRRLGEDAGEYDADALEFEETSAKPEAI